MIKLFLSIAVSLCIFSANANSRKVISVMSYNLENLFDTKHDEGKEDWTYLPLSVKKKSKEAQAYCRSLGRGFYQDNCRNFDWNERTFKKKIMNLGKVIKSFDNGQGPDIVVVQEVENLNALTQLAKMGLKDQGYNSIVLIEGSSSRGIDVGIISRFPLVSKKLHTIKLERREDGSQPKTRGILEAIFQVGVKKVAVLGNHWPSKRNPATERYTAAKKLYSVASQLDADVVLSLGDFNTTKDDRPHGIRKALLDKRRKHSFLSADIEARPKHLGTHFHRGHWAFLDKIFITKTSLKNALPLWDSYKVIDSPFVLHDSSWISRGERRSYRDIPYRFDPKSGGGFSDHLAVGMKFVL